MSDRVFTPEQQAVIQHGDGHAWVSAVAGSGKTSVLVERVARLLMQGVSPNNIVVVQFNKSAQEKFARDLTDRLNGAPAPGVRTFHSIAHGMCKRLVALGRLPQAKHVSSPEKAMRIAVRQAWKAANPNDERPGVEVEQAFVQFVSGVKSQLDNATAYFKSCDYPPNWHPFIAGFENYEKYRRQRQWRSFDDMCWEPVMKMLGEPELWRQFTMFDHVLVDEAQDCNDVQYEMVRGLAGDRASVMMVGDVDQTIYEWRGANTKILLDRFPREFAPCTRYPMTRTFRFGHAVALMATQLITHNANRDDKIVVSHPSVDATAVRRLPHKDKKASGLVADLLPLQKSGRLHEALILSRYTLGTIPYELELIDAQIPYHFYGRAATILVPELAVMVGALAVGARHWPMEIEARGTFIAAMLMIPTMYLPGEYIEEVVEQMAAASMAAPDRVHEPLQRLADRLEASGQRSAARVRERAEAIALLCSGAMDQEPPDMILGMWSQVVGLDAYLAKSNANLESGSDSGGDTSHLMQAFRKMASGYNSVVEFLDRLGASAGTVASAPPPGDHVHIRTIHGAKGLEANRVYVVGLVDGQFPATHGSEEEERRLAYVAMTRARQELVLLHPDDAALEEMISDVEKAVPVTRRSASTYLYESEVGLSTMLADALSQQKRTTVVARDPMVAQRYLKDVEGTFIRLKKSTVAGPARRRLTTRDSIQAGMRVWTQRLGECEVIRLLYGPVWQVRCPDGSFAYEALSSEGWVAK